jgi:hypothetical protein
MLCKSFRPAARVSLPQRAQSLSSPSGISCKSRNFPNTLRFDKLLAGLTEHTESCVFTVMTTGKGCRLESATGRKAGSKRRVKCEAVIARPCGDRPLLSWCCVRQYAPRVALGKRS